MEKSEGFWSDPTSNDALESPTDDIYDGQWQLPEQIPGQAAPEENKTMPERAFHLLNLQWLLHILSNSFDLRN